jgi:S-adenosylmethionine/arginine decarboxylase-like enzyme
MHWGLSCSIDLFGCPSELIDDAAVIREFALELCQLIKMTRYGEPEIVRFGDDPKVAGYTLVQLLTTSSLTAHFAPYSNTAYIDLFSCRNYDPQQVVIFCQQGFKADSYRIGVNTRG